MTDVTPPGIRVQIILVRIMLNNMAHDNMVFPYAKKQTYTMFLQKLFIKLNKKNIVHINHRNTLCQGLPQHAGQDSIPCHIRCI